MENDKKFLLEAIKKAEESMKSGGFPAGSVIIKDGEIIASGISIGNLLKDPTCHSDVQAIRDACKELDMTDLAGATLYTSMQPCLMCLGTAVWSNISRIVFACGQDKVSPEYYGGNYSSDEINSKLLRPINIEQISELEADSLTLVKKWEENLTK